MRPEGLRLLAYHLAENAQEGDFEGRWRRKDSGSWSLGSLSVLVGVPGIAQRRLESSFLYKNQANHQTPLLFPGLAQVGRGWSAERKLQVRVRLWMGLSCPGLFGLTGQAYTLFPYPASLGREVVAPTLWSSWVTLYGGAALATFAPCKSPGLSEKLEPSPRSLFLGRV